FITAYDAMVTRATLAPGETVLIHAAASGVGTAAIQIARALGARPIGTSRTADKLERARKLGLADAIVVRDARFDNEVRQLAPKGGDVILDLVGGNYLGDDIACAASRGRIVILATLGGAHAELALGSVLGKRLSIYGSVLRSRPLSEKIEVNETF